MLFHSWDIPFIHTPWELPNKFEDVLQNCRIFLFWGVCVESEAVAPGYMTLPFTKSNSWSFKLSIVCSRLAVALQHFRQRPVTSYLSLLTGDARGFCMQS